MISNSQLVAKLRELGFHFDTGSKRAQTYKKSGGAKRVTFNTRDWYEDGEARSLIGSAGMDHAGASFWTKDVSAKNAETNKSHGQRK